MEFEFSAELGAPPSVALDKLISWTDHTNDGVRYFSGTATYERTSNSRRPVKRGPRTLAGSRRGEKFRRSFLERAGLRRALEATVPLERHRRRETRCQQIGRQGYESLAKPVDRRRAVAAGRRVGRQATQGMAAMVLDGKPSPPAG